MSNIGSNSNNITPIHYPDSSESYYSVSDSEEDSLPIPSEDGYSLCGHWVGDVESEIIIGKAKLITERIATFGDILPQGKLYIANTNLDTLTVGNVKGFLHIFNSTSIKEANFGTFYSPHILPLKPFFDEAGKVNVKIIIKNVNKHCTLKIPTQLKQSILFVKPRAEKRVIWV